MLLLLTQQAEGRLVTFTHDFPVKGHSRFSAVCMFFLPIVACVYVILCPVENLAFLSIFGLCKFPCDDFIVQNGPLFSPRLLVVFAVTFWGLL